MTWIKNLRMAGKLMLGFGLVALLAGFVGYQGLQGVSTLNTTLKDFDANSVKPRLSLEKARVDVLRLSRSLRNAVLDSSEGALEKYTANMAKYGDEFMEHIQQYTYRSLILRTTSKNC